MNHEAAADFPGVRSVHGTVLPCHGYVPVNVHERPPPWHRDEHLEVSACDLTSKRLTLRSCLSVAELEGVLVVYTNSRKRAPIEVYVILYPIETLTGAVFLPDETWYLHGVNRQI